MNKINQKLLTYKPKIKDYILISFVPFWIMSLFVMLPSPLGVVIITDGIDGINEPEEQTPEEDKNLIRNFYLVIFTIYPPYLLGEMCALLFLAYIVGITESSQNSRRVSTKS